MEKRKIFEEKDLKELDKEEIDLEKLDLDDLGSEETIEMQQNEDNQIYQIASSVLLDLIVKYKYSEIKENQNVKGNFINEILLTIKKYPFISKEIQKNMNNKILRSIFPYVEIFNNIIENLKKELNVNLLEDDLVKEKLSKKKIRRDFQKQKVFFLKCNELFGNLKIFTKLGSLNLANTLNYEDERIKKNFFIFFKNICKYGNEKDVWWLINEFKNLKVYKIFLFEKNILFLNILEILAERQKEKIFFQKKEIKINNFATEEYHKKNFQRLFFKEKCFFKNLEKKFFIKKREKMIFKEIFEIFLPKIENLFFVNIEIPKIGYTSYYSVILMDFIIKDFRNEIKICYENFFLTNKSEIYERTEKLIKRENSEELSHDFEFGEDSGLSNASDLRESEQREIKKLRDILKNSEENSESEDIEISESNKKISIDKKYEKIFIFLRKFEEVKVNYANIQHLIKQIELFNAVFYEIVEERFLELENETSINEKAMLSPVFYINTEMFLRTKFLRKKFFKKKHLLENFSEYFLISVLFFYNYTFLKNFKFVDFENFKKVVLNENLMDLTKNKSFIENCYVFLEQSMNTCEIKGSCTFCTVKDFDKCKIFYITNLLHISLSRNDNLKIHFSVPNLFIVYAIFKSCKNQNLSNHIIDFCELFLKEFVNALKADVFFFGKIFFDFEKKAKKKNKSSNKNIEDEDLEDFDLSILENMNFNYEENENYKNNKEEKSNKKETKSDVFKRLKKNILDDD